jgi:hypothetical protein
MEVKTFKKTRQNLENSYILTINVAIVMEYRKIRKEVNFKPIPLIIP